MTKTGTTTGDHKMNVTTVLSDRARNDVVWTRGIKGVSVSAAKIRLHVHSSDARQPNLDTLLRSW